MELPYTWTYLRLNSQLLQGKRLVQTQRHEQELGAVRMANAKVIVVTVSARVMTGSKTGVGIPDKISLAGEMRSRRWCLRIGTLTLTLTPTLTLTLIMTLIMTLVMTLIMTLIVTLIPTITLAIICRP